MPGLAHAADAKMSSGNVGEAAKIFMMGASVFSCAQVARGGARAEASIQAGI